MTTSEQRPPGLFSRAETGSRRATLLVGAGVFAYVVGSLLTGGIRARLLPVEGPSSETARFVVGWLLSRVWLFAVLPAFGFGAGRLMQVRAFSFAVVAALTGEAFGVLLITAMGGLDMVAPTLPDLGARAVTLLAGIALTQWATSRGQAAASRAQDQAEREALARKAEYDEFLARAAQDKPRDARPSEGGGVDLK